MTTVKDLREIAENILEQLEGLDEDGVIYTVHDTYYLRSNTILETRGGFLDYSNIHLQYGEEDYEDDEESYSIKPAIVRPVVRNSTNPNKRPPTPKKKSEVKRTADRKAAPKKTTKRTTVKTAPTRNKAAPKRSVSNGVRR